MPTTNFFFNNFGSSGEQNLIEDLIIESIKIYGIECFYMPRTLIKEDNLFGEDILSKFEAAHPIEMYIKSVDGFDGDGTFLSKFNIEIRDEMTLTVSRRRFGEEVMLADSTEDVGRPSEGDLIYFPLNGKIFEVKFVEHENIFYQMGSLQTYDLRCELFEYSHERIDTGFTDIDQIETDYSGDKFFFEMLAEDGDRFVTEEGDAIILENYRIENTDKAANNEFFQAETAGVIDFGEMNPFVEGGEW